MNWSRATVRRRPHLMQVHVVHHTLFRRRVSPGRTGALLQNLLASMRNFASEVRRHIIRPRPRCWHRRLQDRPKQDRGPQCSRVALRPSPRADPVNSNPSSNPSPSSPTLSNPNANLKVSQRRAAAAESGAKSVIGNDLRIIGQGLKIISQGTLQVDGEVEGDVGGSEVIIGEKGRVTGTVAAERVIVRGHISGVIRGVTVAIRT